MAAEYRWLYADWRSRQVLGELPVVSGSFSEVLNAAGSFRATIPTRTNRPGNPEVITTADFGVARTLLFVERGGTIVWGGILWTMDHDHDAGQTTLGAEGFHSYFKHRVIPVANISLYDSTQQAVDLITTYTSYAASLFVAAPAPVTPSGNVQLVEYAEDDLTNVADAIERLAKQEPGFDFRYVSRRSGNQIQTDFITSVPTTGHPTDYVFEQGSNVQMLGLSEDATTLETRVWYVGPAGGDGTGSTASAIDAPTLGTDYPLLDGVAGVSSAGTFDTVGARAARQLKRGTNPAKLPRLNVFPDTIPEYGTYFVGDLVRVIGQFGLAQVDGSYRITGITVDVTDGGGEQIKLDLAIAGMF